MTMATWKKNLRAIPKKIREKLESLKGTIVVVSATKQIALSDIVGKEYTALGIRAIQGGIESPANAIPRPNAGKYSRRNIEGWEEVRKDLPKIWKTFGFEAPDWGDWANGSHTVWHDREVYQREYHEPREIPISIERLREIGDTFVFKFVVECPLDPQDENFEDDVLFCLNLLQENVGVVDIYRSDATREEYEQTIHVDWEIFPPGTVDEVMRHLLKRGRRGAPKAEEEARMRDRVQVFSSLRPDAYIRGTGGLNSYIGAKFADDLVVFENVRYGNALYVLYDEWESISQRSRYDLIRGTDTQFDRIIHGDVWKEQFSKIIRRELKRRGRKRAS